MDKERQIKLQEFADENKDLLVMFASPRHDLIYVSFGGYSGLVKFPGTDMDKGVVFNALRKSKFADAIDPFMTGLMEASGISDKEDGGEVLKAVGGIMKSIGDERDVIKKNINKTHAKKNK